MVRVKKNILIGLLIVVMLLGLLLAAWPIISNYVHEKAAAKVKVNYEQTVDQTADETIKQARDNAEQYNSKLYAQEILPGEDPIGAGYFSQLDPNKLGIMGYVDIPKIEINLPIYHGVSSKVLQKGAGHMSQTSLPCGGINTHAAISAHTGLASAPMFTDLVELEIGDVFFIHTLGEKLAYKVDQILIVKPEEVGYLSIVEGKDYLTLITCTPYGVNSHRLLVRGERTDISEDVLQEDSGKRPGLSAYWANYLKACGVGLISAVILFSCVIAGIYLRRSLKGGGKK